ncbi:MAG: hypothetical protein AAGF90_08425 [Pseudomonadota bacterium]
MRFGAAWPVIPSICIDRGRSSGFARSPPTASRLARVGRRRETAGPTAARLSNSRNAVYHPPDFNQGMILMNSLAAFAVSFVAALAAATGAAANTFGPTGPPPLLDPPSSTPYPIYEFSTSGADYYLWNEDLACFAPGDVFLELRVTAPFEGIVVPTFQLFGNCVPDGKGLSALFSFEVNGVATPLTWLWPGHPGAGGCLYHTLEDVELELGLNTLTAIFDGVHLQGDAVGPAGTLVNVRIGNIIPAIPGPPSIFALLTAIAGLAIWRRRRSV